MFRNILLPIIITFFVFCTSNNDIQVIGHRGAMGHALENTLESVKKAIALKADGIEIDVFKTKSGDLVVYHDSILSRLSNSNAFIEEISLDSIKKIQLINGSSIPTLNEVIDLIPDDIFLNIELKGKGTAIPTIEILRNYFNKDLIKEENLLISSFDWDELLILRSVSQEIPIGVLIDGNPLLALKFAEEVKATSINSDYKFLNKKNIELINAMGYKLFPYTVNDKDEMKKLISLGVDGIITDYPDKLKNILNNF